MLPQLLEELKIENMVNEFQNKVLDLSIYEINELKKMEEEIRELKISILQNFKSYRKEKMLQILNEAETKIKLAIYEKEEWKINYFYPAILTSSLIGFGLGSFVTKNLLDYDFEKFCKYLESNLRKKYK